MGTMLPKFIVIGAQKSSSSFMHLCLSDHPDVYMPDGETPFFESPGYENNDIQNFEKMFDGREEKCPGIRRPNYIGKPEVPSRIYSHLPKAKLIAILRNPVDRAISAYFHYINYGLIPPIDLEEGMRKVILSDPQFISMYRNASDIIEFGYYYKYLRMYDQYMKNDQLLVFLFEDIVSNPLRCIQRTYDFLGIPRDFVPKSLGLRPQRVLYNLTRLKLLTHRNRFMYSYHHWERTRLFIKKMTLYDKICYGSLTFLDRWVLALFLPNNKPKVGLELRSMLHELYSADIESLEGYIGRDLSAWKSSELYGCERSQ